MKQGWQVKRLGDVCDVIGGGTPSKANKRFYDGDIPWATVRDMRSEIIENTEFKITREAVRSSSTNIIPKGNVIIATRVGLGKVCIIRNDTAINQDLRGIIPQANSKLTTQYLFLWLKSISHTIEEEGTGATVQGVKLPFIKSLEIPIPSLPEQQRIVAFLDESFAALARAKANAEKNLVNARELFEAVLQSSFENAGNTWEEKKLGELASEMQTGPFGSTLHKSDYVANGIPVVNPQNIVNGEIIPLQKMMVDNQTRDRMRRYILREEDIVLARRGEMGRCAIVKKEQAGWLCGSGSFVIRIKKEVDTNYLLAFLGSAKVKAILQKGSVGTTMDNLNQAILSQLDIPFPPLPEQRAIVAKLDALSAETKKLEAIYRQKLAALEELKKSILQKAFEGEL